MVQSFPSSLHQPWLYVSVGVYVSHLSTSTGGGLVWSVSSQFGSPCDLHYVHSRLGNGQVGIDPLSFR